MARSEGEYMSTQTEEVSLSVTLKATLVFEVNMD